MNTALIVGMGGRGGGGMMNANGEVAIPLEALAQPDETDQMQTPGKGDTVSFQCDGTVTRVDGDNAYVKVSAVNGKPVTDDDEDEEGEEDDDSQQAGQDGDDSGLDQEGQSLRDEAQGMSQ